MSTNTILLVEDDLNLRNSFTMILQRAGYLVTPTDCAHKISEMIRDGRYRLVIADLNMPETKELVIPIVVGNYPYLSLVVLSDRPTAEMDKDELLLSAYYLMKPVAPERLLDCIGMVLGSNHHIL